MIAMKKAPAVAAKAKNARQAIDASIDDLRKAVAEVQQHLDVITRCCDEAKRVHRDHIRCEPRSLVRAAELAEIVRQSVEKAWNKSKPRPF